MSMHLQIETIRQLGTEGAYASVECYAYHDACLTKYTEQAVMKVCC